MISGMQCVKGGIYVISGTVGCVRGCIYVISGTAWCEC